MIKSSNPAFGVFDRNSDALNTARFGDEQIAKSQSNTMTIGGTVTATSILLSIVAAVAIFAWQNMVNGGVLTKLVMPIGIASFVLGIAFSIMIYRNPKRARIIAPIYAVIEGLFVGTISYLIPAIMLGSSADPNAGNTMQTLIIQAVVATFGVTAVMLIGYATGVLRLGKFMKKVIIVAAGGLVLYVGALYLSRFVGFPLWDGFWSTGPMGIAFTVGCVALGSLFLLLDFEFIENGVQNGAPKYMEWVGAWGLMVTIVWLYIQILRLLTKLQSRD